MSDRKIIVNRDDGVIHEFDDPVAATALYAELRSRGEVVTMTGLEESRLELSTAQRIAATAVRHSSIGGGLDKRPRLDLVNFLADNPEESWGYPSVGTQMSNPVLLRLAGRSYRMASYSSAEWLLAQTFASEAACLRPGAYWLQAANNASLSGRARALAASMAITRNMRQLPDAVGYDAWVGSLAAVVYSESRGNPDAYNPQGPAFGWLQMTPTGLRAVSTSWTYSVWKDAAQDDLEAAARDFGRYMHVSLRMIDDWSAGPLAGAALAVFLPASGGGLSYRLTSRQSAANAGMRTSGDYLARFVRAWVAAELIIEEK